MPADLPPTLTLIGRGYCHLCELMRDDLYRLVGLPAFRLIECDVDADEQLLIRFDELVPVLLGEDGQEICHYHLDEPKVREYLRRFE